MKKVYIASGNEGTLGVFTNHDAAYQRICLEVENANDLQVSRKESERLVNMHEYGSVLIRHETTAFHINVEPLQVNNALKLNGTT